MKIFVSNKFKLESLADEVIRFENFNELGKKLKESNLIDFS
jgi:hypothetical protein